MVQWTPRISRLDALQLLLTMALVASVMAAVLGTAAVARPLSKLLQHLDDVTHDLRTPISSLQIAIEQAADAASDAASRELLHGALKDVVYLGALTANLRLASQLREGWDPRAARAKIDLGEVVERVAARARILARRGGVALELARPDEAVPAACDPVAAEQAIGNVIDNAVAYGDRGGHVAVVLERSSGTGGGFTLCIEDDGPGVAPKELPRLGERTFRSDEARARDPRGSGLGLAITAEVCARCGWSLAFEPASPRGLRVTIRGQIA
jgi:signal transduction histidine kinase